MAFSDPSITFGSTGLQNESSNNPTAIDYSKNGEPIIYVTQQNGLVYRYEIDRLPNDEYTVTNTIPINIIPSLTQNYNDDGATNGTAQRQVTGIVVTKDDDGNDVLYVSSSDWRIAVGNDTGLDTNSGQIHKIVVDPDGNILSNVAILRGLPRSEENHSTNGLDISIDPVTGDEILWIAQGGNTNKGAPGNNFAGTVDYVLSGTIIKVNLSELENYDIRIDANGDPYVLDLPTLDDPTRDNVDLVNDLGLDPNDIPENFALDKGPAGHEDNPDFAGGNNGLNMAKITDQVLVSQGGELTFVDNPLTVHAPGFRNQYDVLVTEAGEVYTWDNGPNTGWGGQPKSFSDGEIVDDWTSELATNEFNEDGSSGFGDQLHYLGEITDEYGPYGGDANPLRASKEAVQAAFNPDGSYKGATDNDPIVVDGVQLFANKLDAEDYLSKLLIIYEEQGNSNWVDVTGATGLPADFFDVVSGYDWEHPGSALNDPKAYYDGTSVMDGTAYSPESELIDPNSDGSLKTINSSTNGLAEYTGSFFGGALQGAIIAAAFNGNLYFEKPIDTDGDGRTDAVDSLGTIGGFGSQPLAVMALGDDGFSSTNLIDDDGDGVDDFAGIVIAATYGADNITIFTPGGEPADPSTDLDLDGLNNTIDTHVGDPTEGLGVRVGANETELWHFELNDPDTTPAGARPNGNSIAGDIGINAVWRNDTTVQVDEPGQPALYDAGIWNLGGASTIVSIDQANTGSAEGNANDQADVLGLGFAIESSTGAISIVSEGSNIFTYSPNSDKTWDGGEKWGLVVGPGNQTTFAQAAIATRDEGGTIKYGIELLVEENDVNSSLFVEIPGIEAADVGLSNPAAQIALDIDLTFGSESITARARYADSDAPNPDGFTDWVATGALALPQDVVDAIRGDHTNQGKPTGAFVGLLATAEGGDDSFAADWDYVTIEGSPREFTEGEVVLRWNAGASDIAAIDGGPDWITSSATITGSSKVSTQNAANNGLDGSVPTTAPAALYTQEVYGDAAGNPLGLDLGDNLAAGDYAVRLYMGNGFSGTSAPGQRVFDVSVEGQAFLNDVDLSDQFGHQVGGMFEWVGTVTDGTIDIDFTHVTENPLINAVEVIALGTGDPAVSVADASAGEESGTLNVSISAAPFPPADEDILVTYEVRPVSGGATPEVDYTVPGASYIAETGTYSAQGTISGGSGDFTFPVTLLSDGDDEGDEVFEVVLTSVNGANATIVDSVAVITIEDDDAAPGTVIYRVNAGGEEIAATDGGPAWSADFGDVTNGSAVGGPASPFLVDRGIDGTTIATSDNVTYGDATPVGPGTNSTGAPDALFTTERFSAQENPNNIGYAFGVADGDYTVNLYFDELFFNATGERVFDIEVEGNLIEDDFDTYAAFANDTGVVSVDVSVTDGELNVELLKTEFNNPHIAAIEIVSAGDQGPVDSVNGVVVPGGDFSTDAANPSAIVLPEGGETTIVSNLEGGHLDRDFITVTIPDGYRLADLILTDYQADPGNAGFIGLKLGGDFVTDPPIPGLGNTPDGVVEPGDLEGGHIINDGDIGTDLLPAMNASPFGFAGFDEDALTGDVTIWLNQGGSASEATLTFVTEEISVPGNIVAAINAGGPALSQDGIDFVADTAFLNGTAFTDNNGGNGQQPVFDGTVFETERYGGAPGEDPLAYAIPVQAGTYDIELYFAEIYQDPDALGARVFDVFVEGELVLDDYDILAQTGGDINTPVVVTLPGSVSPDLAGDPNALDITFGASADNAKISAIVVREAEPEPSGGEATLSVTVNSNDVQTSNFGNNSFQVENTGTKAITKIEIDVTNALYPDSVFDPFGVAGDTIAKALTINTPGGTGVVAPNSASYIGAGGIDGFEGIQLLFDENVSSGFNPGETVGFAVDMDPNSIAGALKGTLDSGANPAWDIGGISGAELIGSTFTVTFADGTTATGQLGGADNQGGSKGVASQDSPQLEATLTVNGNPAGDTGTYSDGGPTVVVDGPAGQVARVVLTKGIIQPFTNNFPDDPADPNEYHDQLDAQLADLAASDFPANNAAEFQTVDITLTGTPQDISNLFDFTEVPGFTLAVDEDKLPLGFVVSIIDPANNDLPLGPVSAPIYLTYADNVAPVITDIPDAEVNEGEEVTFTVNATDGEGDAISLSVELTSDADGSVVDPADYTFTDNGDGTGSFSWTTDEPDDGSYTATVSADDGTSTSTQAVSIIVNEVVGPQPGDILYRVNAGGAEVAATDGGPAWTADTKANNSPFLINPGSNDTFSNGAGATVDLAALSGRGLSEGVMGIERWDNTNDANGEMAYSFAVEAGTEVTVSLFIAEMFTGLPDENGSGDPVGDRIFDVSVDGVVPAAFDDIDPYGLTGDFNVGAVVSYTLVSDGSVDLEFLHGSENPAVKAIEIAVAGTPDTAGPAGTLTAADVTAAGADYTFTVEFSDATGVDVSSLGDLDVTVSNGAISFIANATLEDVDVMADGTPRTATYAITPPGGSWDATDNGTYTVTLNDAEVADILGNATGETTLGTFDVNVPDARGELGIQVTPGQGLGASTFAGGSFILTNASEPGVQITSVSIDLSTAILPDMVFDPTGAGGDATASPFTPNSGAVETGLVVPGDPASDPFSDPRNGGFDVLTIDFTDFDVGETFTFTTDIDPNSIQSVPGAGAAGAVSGYELIGATITTTFSDGTTSTGSLFDEGSLGGSQGVVSTTSGPAAPTLAVLGANGDAVPSLPGEQVDINGTDFTVVVTGEPGASVQLLQMDSRLFIASGNPPFDVSDDELPFYANEAMAGKALFTGTIGPGGTLEVPASLLESQGASGTPDGGVNYFMAVVSSGGEVSTTSAPLVVKKGAPLIYDAPGVMEFDGSPQTVIELPHGPGYEIAQGTVAFSFTAADTDGNQGLFTKDASGYAGGGNHFAVYLDGNTLTARFQDGANEVKLEFDGISAGTEYEVAATFGPGGAELWVNGNLVASDPLVMDWTTNVEFIQWGALGWGSDSGEAGFVFPFEGSITDKQVYSEVLTASQIAALAAGSSGNNTPPTANDDSATTDEDTPVNIDVLANDTDDDGDTVAVDAVVSGPSNGEAVIEADGTVTYTPDGDFNGSDSFTVSVTDGKGGFDNADVTVTVDPVNDDPTANDDSVVAVIGQPLIIPVLSNDIDVDGDTVTITAVTDGINGTVVDNGDGTVTYTPGALGSDSFTYTIEDGNGGQPSQATVTVDVLNAPNTPPVAVADTVVVAEDETVTFQPGSNDTDADGNTVTASAIISGPTSGTAEVVAGEVVYTPGANFNGQDSFEVEVTDGNGGFDTAVATVEVTPVNDDPVANDDAATTGTDTPIIINVVGNDTDVDGDSLSVSQFDQGTKGTVSDNGNGTLLYTPNAGETGEDTFTYTVSDGDLESVATVTVNITSFPEAVYDASAPMQFDGTNGSVLELPHTPLYAFSEGTVAFEFTAADTSGDQGLFVKDASGFAGGGNHLAIYLDGSVLKARFQDGTNSETIEISGITAGQTYDIAATFDAGGSTLYVDGVAVGTSSIVMDWTQNVEYIQWGGRGWGSDSGAAGFDAPFEGTIAKKQVYNVSLTADQVEELHADGPPNADPVAVDDAISVLEDEQVTFDPTDNDTDIDSTGLVADQVVIGPTNGTAIIQANGAVVYTPDADFNGNDSFELLIADGDGGFDTSTVSVTVDPVEDDPRANDDTAQTSVDEAVTIDVLANDEEVDGQGLSIVGISGVQNGQAVNNGDGTVTFTPNAGFDGTGSFTYEVSDGDGPTDTADVTIGVTVGPTLPTPLFEQGGVTSYTGSSSGVDNYAPDPALQIPEGTIAFSFVDDAPSVRQGLVVKDASGFVGGGNHFAAYIEKGDLKFRFQDGAESSTFAFGITAGQEYEVAAVFTASGVEVWINGELEYEDAGFVMNWEDNAEWLQVGGLGWGSDSGDSKFGNPFSGDIADVEIYGEALDENQIGLLAGTSSFDTII